MSYLLNTCVSAMMVFLFFLILSGFMSIFKGWLGIPIGIFLTAVTGLMAFATSHKVICDLKKDRSYVKAFVLAALGVFVFYMVLGRVYVIFSSGIWTGFPIGIPLIAGTGLVASLIAYELHSRRTAREKSEGQKDQNSGTCGTDSIDSKNNN